MNNNLEKKIDMSKAWYAYIYGDPLNIMSYRKIEIKPSFLCGQTICAVYIEDHGSQSSMPFSANMISYIKKGLATEMMQPDQPFDGKKYVYLKY